VVHVDDATEREKRRIGRPSKVEDFRKLVVKILEEKPDLPSLEILRRVREAGYQGGKTALHGQNTRVLEQCLEHARSPLKRNLTSMVGFVMLCSATLTLSTHESYRPDAT
jgi:hypothetical protein